MLRQQGGFMQPRINEWKAEVSRREFVWLAMAASVAAGVASRSWADEQKGDMPQRTLGRTGEKVSAIGLGGFHLGTPPEEESIKIVRSAVDGGITFMDNSWDYNEGQSEIRMGKALKDGYRQKVFLMTKLDGRTKEVAQQQIETSLQR